MDTLTKVLTASIDLFSQYGFKTITMDDIARRAGISKKTLYQQFANKQEVVNESLLWYKEHMMEDCGIVIGDAANAVEEMVLLLSFMDKMNKRINPMALFELQRFFPEAYSIFRSQLISKDVSMIRDNILRGVQEGFYRVDLNAELLARYRLETSLMILQPNLIVNDQNDLINVTLEIGEHFMYGIMTPKGEELYKQYKQKYLKQAAKI